MKRLLKLTLAIAAAGGTLAASTAFAETVSSNAAVLRGKTPSNTQQQASPIVPAAIAPYCTNTYTSAIEPITLVQINDINNTSSAATGGTAHEDFTAITGTLRPGATYAVTMKANTDGTTFQHGFALYVDWNGNGDFTDAGEGYWIGEVTGSTGTDAKSATAYITVPAGATLGNTRLRAMTAYNTTSLTALPPCRTGSGYGQSEDYTVTIDTNAAVPELPLSVSAAFSPTSGAVPVSTTLQISIGNLNVSATPITADFTTTLPTGMTLAANATTTCSGTFTGASGDSAITLASGAAIPAGGCTISASVAVATGGNYSVAVGPVASAAGNSSTGSATFFAYDSSGSTAYSTGFEAPFTVGTIHGQQGWQARASNIADVTPANGTQHFSQTALAAPTTSTNPLAISGQYAVGTTRYVAVSANLRISHTTNGASWQFQPQDNNSGLLTTIVRLNRTGNSIDAYTWNAAAGTGTPSATGATFTPDTYFNLKLLVDRVTSNVRICKDGAQIYESTDGNGTTGGNNVDNMVFQQVTGSGQTANNTFFADDLDISYTSSYDCSPPAVTTYTVTPSVTGNGTITPDTPQTVDEGDTIDFALAADPGNHLVDVTGSCPGTLSGTTWTAGPITGDCTVVANFEADPVVGDPAISVAPASLSGTAAAGDSTTVSLTITNTGGGSLTWTIDESPDSLSPLGSRPDVPVTHPNTAIAQLKQAPWSINRAAGAILPAAAGTAYALINDVNDYVSFDPASPGSFTHIGVASGSVSSMWGGGFVGGDPEVHYLIGDTGLKKYTASTRIVTTINASTGSGDVWAGTVDPVSGKLYYVGPTSAQKLYSVDLATGTATLAGTITGPASGHIINGLAADASGNLWATDKTNDTLVKLDKATGASTTVGALGIDSEFVATLAFGGDGVAYFASALANGDNNLYSLNTGTGAATLIGALTDQIEALAFAGGGTPVQPCQNIADVPWLSASPSNGSTASGSNSSVSVVLDATGLAAGSTYAANLCVNSNDTANPTVSVPVSFTVTSGGDPTIAVSPSALSSSQAIGATTTQTLTVANTGGGMLNWTIDEENSASLPPMPTSHHVAQPASENVGASVTHAGGGNHSAAVWLAPMAVLYDNGPLVTDPGAGAGGKDASALQTAVGNTTYGSSVSASGGLRAADDITVPSGGWTIDKITVFTYQTGSSTTSTITGANLRIWNGVPGAAGSTVVFGDTTTNRMASSAFSNIYRVLDTGLTNTDRPIMAVVINVGTTLPAGTYWLDWQLSGSLASGPWAPPVTIAGQTGKPGANAMQYNAGWVAVEDGGSFAAQDFPFIVEGTAGPAAPACTSPSDIPWLSLSATSGSNAGGTNTPVTVTFNSTGMTAGSYSAKLCVASNDAANPMVQVPVSLTVTGGGGSDLVCFTPNHTISQTFNGTYIRWEDNTFADDVSTLTGWNFNPYGATTLTFFWNSTGNNAGVSSGTTGGNWLVLNNGDVVGPSSTFEGGLTQPANWNVGTDGALGFRFNCSTASTCYGYAHMTTTAGAGHPAVLTDYCFDKAGNPITVTGGVPLNPPAATVTPTSLSMSAPANGTATTTLNIANAAGSSALTYSVQAQAAALRPHVSSKVARTGSASKLTQQRGPVPQEKLDYLAARENAHPKLLGSGVRGGSTQHGVPWAPTGSIVFALDDGTYEDSIGWTDQASNTEYSALWLNRFTATGAMTIDSVSIMWPTLLSGNLVGKQVNIVAYYDADGDGDPSNAVRLGTDNLQTIASLDSFISYATSFSVPAAGDVYIGFFNTYANGGTTPAMYPAAIDENTVIGQSWVAANDEGDADLDLGANDEIGTIDDLSGGSLVGTWLIRATGTGGGSGTSCTGPVVTWLTATPASGSVNGGANTNLTVKAIPAAASLAPGSYSAELCLTTNDPNHALIAVPVSLTVTPPPFVPCNGGTDEIFCDGFDPAVVTDPDIVTGTINQPVQADGDGSTLDFVTGVWGTYDGSQQNINLYDYGDGTMTVYWYGDMAAVDVGGVVDSGGVEFAVLQSGDTVGPSSTISATSQYMTNWLSGTDGYIGVAFENSETGELNYGYIHLTTTGPLGFPAQALEYAYNKAGNAITIP